MTQKELTAKNIVLKEWENFGRGKSLGIIKNLERIC